MANIVKVVSSEIETDSIDATKKRRSVKVKRFGDKDIQTASEAMPFGFDSCPPEDMIAVFQDTSTKGRSAIVGYINKKQLSTPGELRLYSTNPAGSQVKFYVHLKTDGTMELGGSTKHLARYEELKAGFDELVNKVNDLIANFNLHTHAGNGVPTATTENPTSASIDSSKINEIKTL